MYQQDVSVQKWFRFPVAWKTLDVELEDERLPWRLMAKRYILCIDWLILDIVVSHSRRPTTHNEALSILFSVLKYIVSHVIAICVSKPAYGVASDMPRHSLHCQSKELRSRVDINLVKFRSRFSWNWAYKGGSATKKIELLHPFFFWMTTRSLPKRFWKLTFSLSNCYNFTVFCYRNSFVFE